jgi:hypothetical protein
MDHSFCIPNSLLSLPSYPAKANRLEQLGFERLRLVLPEEGRLQRIVLLCDLLAQLRVSSVVDDDRVLLRREGERRRLLVGDGGREVGEGLYGGFALLDDIVDQ